MAATADITVSHFRVTRVSGRDSMQDYIRLVVAEKRTGTLEIHFSQGTPGAVEWTEREPEKVTTSDFS